MRSPSPYLWSQSTCSCSFSMAIEHFEYRSSLQSWFTQDRRLHQYSKKILNTCLIHKANLILLWSVGMAALCSQPESFSDATYILWYILWRWGSRVCIPIRSCPLLRRSQTNTPTASRWIEADGTGGWDIYNIYQQAEQFSASKERTLFSRDSEIPPDEAFQWEGKLLAGCIYPDTAPDTCWMIANLRIGWLLSSRCIRPKHKSSWAEAKALFQAVIWLVREIAGSFCSEIPQKPRYSLSDLVPFVPDVRLMTMFPSIIQAFLRFVILIFKHWDTSNVILIRDFIGSAESLKSRECRTFNGSYQISTQMNRIELHRTSLPHLKSGLEIGLTLK